jgi:ribosomal protein L11 methyltransferase
VVVGADGPGAWVAVAGRVPVDRVDVVSGGLWAAGAAGVEERPMTDRVDVVELVAAARPEVGVALQAAFAGATEVRVTRLDPSARPDDPWAVGEREVPVAPGVVVRIDPGGAFGHGGHVTTRLALELVVTTCRPGGSLLDVGSGSGVLAVAAARLGAEPVVAVDVDPRARMATRANAASNGVRVRVPAGGLESVVGAFDVVAANLEAPVLVALGPALAARVATGGTAVVAGFLRGRVDDVVAALAPLGVVDHRSESDWVALGLRRS